MLWTLFPSFNVTQRIFSVRLAGMRQIPVILIVLLFSSALSAQQLVTLEMAVRSALVKHPELRISDGNLEKNKLAAKHYFELEDPKVLIQAPNADRYTLGVEQSFEFPTTYGRRKSVREAQVAVSEGEIAFVKSRIVRDVKLAYLEWQKSIALRQLSYSKDSLYEVFYSAAKSKWNAEEISKLELLSVQLKRDKARLAYETSQDEESRSARELIIVSQLNFDHVETDLEAEEMTKPKDAEKVTYATSSTDELRVAKQELMLAVSREKYARSRLLPGFSLGYMNQGDVGSPLQYRFQLGLSVPVWFGKYKAAIKGAEIDKKNAESYVDLVQMRNSRAFENYRFKVAASLKQTTYFEQSAMTNAAEILETAHRLYEAGEIGYVEYLTALDAAFDTKMAYVEALANLNESTIWLSYYQGAKD